MPERSSKGKRADLNLLAKSIVDSAIDEESAPKQPEPQKNPAAVELGRLGGLKGGKARAEKLSAQKRQEIARLAAQKRWARQKEGGPDGEK